MYICVCKAVTDAQIKCAMHEGNRTRRDLFKCLGVGGDCGKCVPHVKELIDGHKQEQQLMQNAGNHSILAA
jgi:bacterioferritin-associated ferredoxin